MKWFLSLAIVVLIALAFSPRADVSADRGVLVPQPERGGNARGAADPRETATPQATPKPTSSLFMLVPLRLLNPFADELNPTPNAPAPKMPRAKIHFPKRNAQNISPDSLISIVFTTPMNRASVETRLRVTRADTGERVDGYIEWENNVMVFYPVPLLESDSTYHVRLMPGAESRDTGKTILKTLEWNFSTGSFIVLPEA